MSELEPVVAIVGGCDGGAVGSAKGLSLGPSRNPIRGIHGIRVIHGHEAGIYMPSSLIFMLLEMAGALLHLRLIARDGTSHTQLSNQHWQTRGVTVRNGVMK
jgi:hypothetical protein